MEKADFHKRLNEATEHAFSFAREMVSNHLPLPIHYIVRLNRSYDGNPLKPGEYVYPDDLALHGPCISPLTSDQVVDLLWREGRIPEWIDIAVVRTDASHTYMELSCCGRFTDVEELLYYSRGKICPFGCKSPPLPPDWKTGDAPFDLLWESPPSA